MNIALVGSVAGTILGWLMGLLSLFLIMLILIQRGKGGGLTGALGGPGGQSAFGSKAGDTFTVITVVVASIWAFTCAFTMWLLGAHAPTTTLTGSSLNPGPGEEQDADPMTVPPIGGIDTGQDAGGIGAAPSVEPETPAEGETEASIELTPAETAESEAETAESEAETAESEAEQP